MSEDLPKKKCSHCHKTKYAYEFNLHKNTLNGPQSKCKDCTNQQIARYKEKTEPKNVDKQKWNTNLFHRI